MPPDVLQAAVGRVRTSRDGSPLADLTPRERQVALMIADGRSNREAASVLGLSEATIKTYVRTIFEKLGADNRTAVALLVARAGARNEPHFRR
jgi:two-component system NarL family response regulator/two-component system nitrate/nitrite response regulator NarL